MTRITRNRSPHATALPDGALRRRVQIALLGATWVMSAACATTPPSNIENLCAIFEEKGGWYKDAKRSAKRWGTPVHVQMAIIRQESSFEFDARPPRRKLLGFIPWTRPSNAYGYAQVLDSTWRWYLDETGQRFGQRDDFTDAIDFVGWYTDTTQRMLGISKWDPYNQYLAYHEGHGGWKDRSYRGKPWLMQTARKVEHRAKEWGAQLGRCEAELDDGWWIF
ncbi:MAG: transglycosylase SLT domain-containing protein [Woeseiaceae bacterium]